MATSLPALAGSATWNVDPINQTWKQAENWTPQVIPGSPGDVATFGLSHMTNVSLDGPATIDSVVFSADASPYTITIEPLAFLTLNAAGLVNNSTIPQNFVSLSSTSSTYGTVLFGNEASTGTQMTFTNQGNSTTVAAYGGHTTLTGTTSALANTFMNQGGTASGAYGGITLFAATSQAGEATITNQPGTVAGANGGVTFFIDSGCGASATITSLGATVNGALGGYVVFDISSRADEATLIAEGGTNGGGGGRIIFSNHAKGDLARVILHGNATLDLTPFSNANLSIGSLEGDGLVTLNPGAIFTVGRNNLSTAFSGVIANGNSLVKTGSGTLTLTGANTYLGGTIVSGGTLVATNQSGSATGNEPVQVNGGTLGGSGTIAGAVTVNARGFLAPAHGSKQQATLTVQSPLVFNAASTYTYSFKAKGSKSKTDQVVANGVTINNGATFNLSGQVQGILTQGTTLTVIKNTAATPIVGTFSNLPDGGIVNVNGNNFQASYEGGDRNDLTLTVVL